MKIIIEKIDGESVLPIGFAKLPSFLVNFRSSSFSGIARFVPASGRPENCEGCEFEVEIAQDSITEFCIIEGIVTPSVEIMDATGSFKVCGVISSVMALTDPIGGQFTFVAVNDALFTLTNNDMSNLRPDVGTSVAFIVHDMSFWDEAI